MIFLAPEVEVGSSRGYCDGPSARASEFSAHALIKQELLGGYYGWPEAPLLIDARRQSAEKKTCPTSFYSRPGRRAVFLPRGENKSDAVDAVSDADAGLAIVAAELRRIAHNFAGGRGDAENAGSRGDAEETAGIRP